MTSVAYAILRKVTMTQQRLRGNLCILVHPRIRDELLCYGDGCYKLHQESETLFGHSVIVTTEVEDYKVVVSID